MMVATMRSQYGDGPAGDALRGDIPFTDADFARVAAFAHREFGLHLAASKKELVYSRLVKRLRATGCPDFATYCARLDDSLPDDERSALITALTTNVTHFFREEHHFRLVADQLLRPRLEALRGGARMRFWSAGCSAGPEPYSLAMTVLSLLPDAPRLNLRILATDIDPAILGRARAAEYPVEEMRSIPEAHRSSMIERLPDRPDLFRIAPRVTGIVRFAQLNLMQDWPVHGPFDAIFCRNVAIYFDKPTQARLWQRFAALLAPGGLLCIGHSERVDGPATALLTSAGITAYRRNATPGPSSAA